MTKFRAPCQSSQVEKNDFPEDATEDQSRRGVIRLTSAEWFECRDYD